MYGPDLFVEDVEDMEGLQTAVRRLFPNMRRLHLLDEDRPPIIIVN
jgi:hypothetical protein